MHVSLRLGAFLCALTLADLHAIEPWADRTLPVQAGLALWLDAASQPAARQARQLPATPRQLEVWLDGSGRGRDVAQPEPARQPKWQQSSGASSVRFDGEDDWLGVSQLAAGFQEATVFVVAAPRANPGEYRGLLAWAQDGKNDYLTGFNLDLGKAATSTFSTLNAEGAGFRGERNLLNTRLDFGTMHVFSVVSAPGVGGTRLFLDSQAEGRRDRAPGTMKMDALAIGARLATNTAAPPAAGHFLPGDLAEILVFERALPDAEREKVERYLIEKHRVVKATLPPGATRLEPVKNPPLVQMFVPGFTVNTLPVELTNIDCLRYRPDGKLVAGAYNGKIWLLTDTDGDGLEDRADLYWQSEDLKGVIGMTLTLPNDPRGEGVFVATQGRILFIIDHDRDGRGDEQKVIASGWEKQLMGGGGGIVDALGLTMDAEGNLYFGLGVSAYANAYEIDAKTGRAGYRIGSERGTIQRISADFSKRETICTGIRYPVGAAFNEHGDLFVTEQEGATWLPNGNMFDELLHIEPGRHYGFPPRHPVHLPNVIDEPSVFDYGPQHQSTCGFAFNAPCFGPAWWQGDALVTGESRGKLYRTKLVKTALGYVAQNQLIAGISMLPVDVAISPKGDLRIACHSGGPDWGTGPTGAGKIVSLSHTSPEAPQPVLTWSASPTEWRVAFDRELDPARLAAIVPKTTITQGVYVAAGDRFESFQPGYQAVKDQLAEPRFNVPVLGIALTEDRRALILTTPPRPVAVGTAITLPDFTGTSKPPRHPQIDLAGDSSGVMVEWKGADGTSWSGWLPHLDLAVARELTSASASHRRLFELLATPGELTLRGQLDLYEMLQPAIQPGARLDYERPVEQVAVQFSNAQPFAIVRGDGSRVEGAGSNKHWNVEIQSPGKRGEWLAFTAVVPTGAGAAPNFTASWSTADDARPRAFPLRRVLVPWAQAPGKVAALTSTPDREIPELQGGNWLRGKKLFYGKATCGTCHRAEGQGGLAGPDLSNLVHRDYASVVRDIREPNAALNPDRLGYMVEPREGAAFTAVLIGGDEQTAQFADTTGVKTVERNAIRSMTALSASFMPPGLLDALSSEEQRDLLTFLLTSFEPAPLEAKDPPPARPRAEVETLLKSLGTSSPTGQATPMRVVLCAGPKDHGKGEHDYPLWQKRWARLLGLGEGVEVETAWIWPTAEQWLRADVVAFFSNNPGWNLERASELDGFLARGKGVAYFHFAVDGHEHGDALAERIGLAVSRSACKYRHGPVEFTLHPHPLTAGLPPLQLVDETYWNLVGDPARLQLIADAVEDAAPRPQLWTREHRGGRVFVSIPGHYNWTFDDPLFRALAFRGLCWAAGQPLDRLAELIPIGARIAE